MGSNAHKPLLNSNVETVPPEGRKRGLTLSFGSKKVKDTLRQREEHQKAELLAQEFNERGMRTVEEREFDCKLCPCTRLRQMMTL